MVLVITHEAGRTYVTSSNALDSLGPKNWLSAFIQWLLAQSLNPELTVEDTLTDPRQALPTIQFSIKFQFAGTAFPNVVQKRPPSSFLCQFKYISKETERAM